MTTQTPVRSQELPVAMEFVKQLQNQVGDEGSLSSISSFESPWVRKIDSAQIMRPATRVALTRELVDNPLLLDMAQMASDKGVNISEGKLYLRANRGPTGGLYN